MIGGDFYDSMEIVLSSLTFMHSQTQSQPWLKVVYQQFLIPNLNVWYSCINFVWIQIVSICKTAMEDKALHAFSGDRLEVNIKTGERLF